MKEPKKNQKLKLVTLTVNNVCNMNCPHCYLQLNKTSSNWVESSILKKILDSNFEHLAIVGKEPLFNKEHVQKLTSFSEKVKHSGKNISLITNGKNLHLLEQDLLKNLDFFDISFDGGKETYEIFRKASFQNLKKEIQRIYNSGYKRINALHSVHSGNIENIKDMMSIVEIIPFEKIMFTPYISTDNFGENSVSRITIKRLFEKLSSCKEFMENNSAIVNIDSFHLEQANLTPKELLDLADSFGLKEKLVLHPVDLLPFGVVRVTYEGRVLTPSQSLNPTQYHEGLELENFKDVNEVFKLLQP